MKSIKLTAKRQSGMQKKVINGVEFLVATSPYFFPERLECEYDKTAGTIVIHFRYIDNEPPADRSGRDTEIVSYRFGKYTRRLLAVTVKVDRHGVDSIEMLVTESIPKEISRFAHGKPSLLESYGVAADAMRTHINSIAQMAPA